ncbi:hypothetical protein CHS0354_034410 [Potamilus streckersoni]|uniref:Uncharacterized protein n=1 Tax=Potamilus streckersoni TaxID=2493646 RepID=A0AAE0VRF6_9BIVA|nr:hypothetical protein CHS0354_034410 [Potamilus streckersoni]
MELALEFIPTQASNADIHSIAPRQLLSSFPPFLTLTSVPRLRCGLISSRLEASL